MTTARTPGQHEREGMKRTLDLAGALVGIALLWPVALGVALAIRLDSCGPAVFPQQRVGRHGRPFRCLKFRSMHVDAPQRPTHESVAADVTRVGRVLRRTKLDELPQLLNVIRGEMSLVGPRPCLPTQRQLIDARRARGVEALRPGITGLAQVNGIDMSDPERLAEADADYARRQSLLLDVRLILASLPFGRRIAPPVAARRSAG